MAATAAARTAGATVPALAAPAKRRLDRIGIQLYTVRAQMRADMPGTVAKIAGFGYKDVEFAGYFGRTAAQVRELLDANGLKSPSTHIGFDAMKADWDKTFDDALAIGQQFITVPSPPEGTAPTVAAWQRVADDFNAAGEKARARDLTLGYHNHYTEFAAVGGTTPFEVLLTRTDPKYVSFQMDVCWATRGGADPRALIRKYPSRFVMLHIKDITPAPEWRQTDLGEGSIDFAGILREDASGKNVVKHVFVEHDQPADPMLFAKKSFDFLSKLEY